MDKKVQDTGNNPNKLFTPTKVGEALKSETTHFVIGLLLVMFGVYMLLAFSSFFFTGGNDQSIVTHPQPGELLRTDTHIQNYAGTQGARISQFFINDCFGLPSYLIIIFLIVAGMKLMKAYQFKLRFWFFGCFSLMIWSSIAFGFALQGFFQNSFIYPGGLHGYNISRWLCGQIGSVGLALALLGTLILIGILFTKRTIRLVRKALHPIDSCASKKQKDKEKEDTDAVSSDMETGSKPVTPPAESEPAPKDDPEEIHPESVHPVSPSPKEEYSSSKEEKDDDDINTLFDRQAQSHGTEEHPTPKGEQITPLTESMKEEPKFIIQQPVEVAETSSAPSDQPYNPRLDLEYYQFPSIDLLKDYGDERPAIDMEEQEANKDRIIQVLRSFGIEITTITASVGPTITLYEITPAEGVRISRIRNLEDDIALKLAALGIRIIAPIPGKGTIGIEVPNAKPHIVPMKSILASKKFQETTFDLPVALGKTITNEVFMVDLAKAPHMLVAGATGQGKSVGLNAIVTSLLYKKHPSELKFVIIDPKKVEFAIYAPIEKYYLAKLPDAEDAIITDVTKVVQTLNSLCIEMDDRYDLLKRAGCRNIKEYNAKFIARKLNPNEGHRFLPYIVVIIDEFGDLIMTAGKDVELPICRIAQLARAVGIHAIIATQRPTTNIITGTIKANFPARVAFKVAAMMDSRTILDRPGAQQLVGKGDMLYLQGNDPVRVQCAFVDTPEVEKIVNFISHQQGYPTAFLLPEYTDENGDGGSSMADMDPNRLDPLFEEAANLVVYHQQGSTSLIQRKFSIGYNRAGRIMDQLEKAGIVGSTNGSKAREVLCMDTNDLEMKLSNLKNN